MRRRSLGAPQPSRGKVFPNSRYSGNNARPKRTGSYIDPTRFVNAAVAVVDEEEFVPQHKFADFAVGPQLKQNIQNRGYVTPTPIQDGAIIPALEGRDVIGLANTGTGKTAAFVIPIIERLKTLGNGTALIMAPTRELAVQIDEEFRGFAKNLGIYSALCVGGANIQSQKNQLLRHPQVIIGTPGRLKDLANQGVLKLGHTRILVLDEADRMLDMGFIRDIRYLINMLPSERQSLCFSATMTPDIERLVHEILTDHVTVSVRKGETSDHVEQNVVHTHSKEHKFQVLTELLAQPGYDKVLVFGQTKWNVQRLCDSLNKLGIKSEALHSNKSLSQRQRALKAFKEGHVQVLVATDIAARGLDIPNVSHVINYDQPNTYDDYIHRIGRTGRAGARGQALTFVSPR